MSLSAWEQQALSSIKGDLADSDPELATLLATFTELALGEEMPVRENIRMTPRWVIRRPHHRGRRWREVTALVHRFLRLRYALMLWLLVIAVLISVALTLSRGSGYASCQEFWPTSCAHPPPVSNPPVPGHGT